MQRVIVPLTKDVWSTLGTGEMVITLHKAGKSGVLRLNQSQVDASSLVITKDRYGDQFSNTSAIDTIEAKASADGWELAVNQ